MIGKCLKNVLGTKGYDEFIAFTPDCHVQKVEEVWASFEKSRHGLNTLKMIVSRVNLEGFKDWQTEVVHLAAFGATKPTASITEIADIAHFLYGHRYIYTGGTSWWEFNGVWQKMTNASTLNQRFSRELSRLFERVYITYSQQIEEMEEPDPSLTRSQRKALDITVGLKDPGFKSKVLRECAETFLRTNFETEADEDHYILAMPNGILDMHDFKNIHVRPAYPDDWVTLQTGAGYYPDIYSWEHPDVQFYMEFKRKIIPDVSTREFSLKHKGSCLMGGNKDKYIPFNIGETAHNGKTTDAKADRRIFGTYSGKLPLGAIVGKTPGVNEVNPCIAATKGTRLQQLDEGNKHQELNASFFKLLGGNDEQWARSLYSNGSSFVPQYNVVMSGNSAPSSLNSAGDAGMTERVVLVPHNSRFVPNPPTSPEEQERLHIYKANPHISNDLTKRRDAGMWIYVQYLMKYLVEGLTVPAAVQKKTNGYRYANDPYLQFVDHKVDKTQNRSDYVPLKDMYVNYKAWFSESFPGKRIDNIEFFATEIERVLSAAEGSDRRIHGVKMKSEVRHYARQGGN
jgi:phage/plasmid-associated DNA primase